MGKEVINTIIDELDYMTSVEQYIYFIMLQNVS